VPFFKQAIIFFEKLIGTRDRGEISRGYEHRGEGGYKK